MTRTHPSRSRQLALRPDLTPEQAMRRVTAVLFAPTTVARYTAALKALQKILGDLTDIKMARTILGKLALEKSERKAARAVLRMRKASHLKRVRAAFERVAAAGGFWQQNRKGVGHV